MDRVLKPFDIISAPYVSLDGSIKVFADGEPQRGLFMVLAVDYDNITCAKITSQDNEAYLANSYCLTKAANYFLRTDSYVQFDKLHTLSVSSATYIGYADKPSRYPMYRILSGYLTGLVQNLKRFCNPPRKKYVSPNRFTND